MYQTVNNNKQIIIVFVCLYSIPYKKTSKYTVTNEKDRPKGKFTNSRGNIETYKLTSKYY